MSRITNRLGLGMEGLEHLIHCARYAVLSSAFGTSVAVAQMEISEQGVLHQALQNYIHVACSPHIVDSPYAASTTRCVIRVHGHELRIFFRGIGEKVI